jgi:SPP1 gp7 family putative phage head morphogenesis protein
MIEGALKADGRLAAKNAVKIRAALRRVTDFKRVFLKYQETMPQPTDNPTQDRVRARSWIMLNVYLNDEPLRMAVTRAWQEAFILGEVAADEWLRKTREANKADDIEVNWDTWKPGDVDTALNIKNFQKYLAKVNADSYFKTFNKETVINLGTALSDSIELGLDAESAAVMISKHVASPSRALTIAITEQNRAMSFSTIERYKDAGLQKMEWAVSDPCDICAKNDGQVIVIGQTFASGDAQPPAHPHCRCVLLPVIPGMEDDDPMGIDGGLAPMPDNAPIVVDEEPTIKGGEPGEGKDITSELGAEYGTTSETKKGAELRAKDMSPETRGDPTLQDIASKQGFDGKAEMVDQEAFDQIVAEGGTVTYRGVTDYYDSYSANDAKYISGETQISEQFAQGPYFGGIGGYGSGTYTSSDVSVAQHYAFEDGAKGGVITMVVKPNAKIATPQQWQAARTAAREGTGGFMGANNEGRILAAQGFDGFRIASKDVDHFSNQFVVVLNRNAVAVLKK